ncbi:MAG: autotransporter-associated beta strand repeat-containing protein [Tepidisphaeraceae bacterium]
MSGLARAASQTWTGNTDASFTTATNWSGSAVPGINPTGNSTNSTDVITFNTNPANGTTNPIIIDGSGNTSTNRMVGRILIDTANAGAFQIGAIGGTTTLQLGNNLTVVDVTSTVVAAQTINAPIALHLPSSTNGAATVQNNAAGTTAILTLAGGILNSPNSTRGTVWTLGGSNTGDNTVSGIISMSNTGGVSSSIIKTGLGTWVLSNANTIPGGVTINGGTLAAANNAALGTNATANNNAINVNNAGTLQIRNGITLDNGLSLNLASGGTIRGVGVSATNGRINVGTAAATFVTIGTTNSTDVFTIGNGSNDLTGGAADSVINITGPGMVLQNVASNYAGGWSVNAGTLKLGSATALGSTSSATLGFGASSTGVVQLNGNSATIVGLSTNATPGSAAIENGAAGTATLTVNSATGTTFAGTLRDGAAGTLALTKGGTSSLTLTGTNTYTGATTIGGGKLIVDGSVSASNVAVNATGTLAGIGSLGGVVTVNSSGKLSAADTNVGTLTVGGLTLGAGSLLDFNLSTPAGSNDLVNVSNVNGLTLNGGTFNFLTTGGAQFVPTVGQSFNLFQYNGALGGALTNLAWGNNPGGLKATFGSNTVGLNTFLTVSFDASGVASNWLNAAGGSWSASVPANWSAAGVPVAAGDTATFGSAISSDQTVTVDGAIAVGGIKFDNAAKYTIAAGSGSLTLDNSGVAASLQVVSGSHEISAPMAVASDIAASVASGGSLQLSGALTESSGARSLSKTGAGTLVLSGINSYTGTTTVSDGILEFAVSGIGSGNLTLLSGAMLRYASGNTADISAGGRVVSINAGGATIDTNGNDVTIAGAIGNNGLGSLTKAGAGKLTLGGTNSYAGATTVNAGTLNIASDGSLGTGTSLTLANGTTLQFGAASALSSGRSVALTSGTVTIDANGFDSSIAGAVSGSALLKKVGSGKLTLSGGTNSTTATGGVQIDAGTIAVATAANLPSGTITLNGTAELTSSAATAFNNVVVNGTNKVTTTSTSSVFGLGTVAGGGSLTFGGPFVNDYTGSLTGFTGTITQSNGGFRFNGTAGGTNLTLDLGSTGVSLRNNATGIAIGALAGTSSSTLTGAGGGSTAAVTYTIGGKTVGGLGITPVNSTFDGSIKDGVNSTTSAVLPVSITKVGVSILTLNGASTYTGNTLVSGGTLLVNGSITSPTTVDTGTLGGSGTISAAVAVNAGGTIAPGNSPGILTIGGNLSFTGGSLAIEMGGNTPGNTASNHDQVIVNGTVTLGSSGSTTLAPTINYTPSTADQIFFLLNDGVDPIVNDFAGLTNANRYDIPITLSVGTAATVNGFLSYVGDSTTGALTGGNDAVIYFTAVPEPATLAGLASLGLLGLARRARR